jgi:hypothetical protein
VQASFGLRSHSPRSSRFRRRQLERALVCRADADEGHGAGLGRPETPRRCRSRLHSVVVPFPTSERRIEDAERQLGRRLPDDLRARLLHHNGGDVTVDGDEWQLYPVWDDSNLRTIARTSNNVVGETREAREWRLFPHGAIVIGGDGSGDLLVLRAGAARVERWSHETGTCTPVDVDWSGPRP